MKFGLSRLTPYRLDVFLLYRTKLQRLCLLAHYCFGVFSLGSILLLLILSRFTLDVWHVELVDTCLQFSDTRRLRSCHSWRYDIHVLHFHGLKFLTDGWLLPIWTFHLDSLLCYHIGCLGHLLRHFIIKPLPNLLLGLCLIHNPFQLLTKNVTHDWLSHVYFYLEKYKYYIC